MGHSAGGHLALLYAYMSAEGATVIDPDSDTEQYFTLSPVQLVISEAGPTEFIAGNMTNLADERKAEICAMAGIDSINESNQAALDAVSPYCVAEQAKEANKTLPFTILAYGYGIQPYTPMSYEKLYGDGLIPIKPALDLYSLLSNEGITTAHISENSGCYSSPNGNFTLYYFYGIAHGDFSGVVHPDTETYESRKPSDCFHLATNTLCNACKNRYATLDIERIESYYTKLKEKLNPSGSN